MCTFTFGDDEAALADLENSIKFNPSDTVARGARAMIYRRNNRWIDSQREYVRMQTQKKSTEEARLAKAAAIVFKNANDEVEGDGFVVGGSSRPLSAINPEKSKFTPASAPARQTPLEMLQDQNDFGKNLKKKLEKQIFASQKKGRQERREARGGNLGGLASTIDRTPPTSPMAKPKVSVREKKSLAPIDISEDVELVDSDDEGKFEEPKSREHHDRVTPMNKNFSTPMHKQSVPATPMSTRSTRTNTTPSTNRSGSFVQRQMEQALSAPTLLDFKKDAGLDKDLFEKLFCVPTDVQKSLLTVPHKRTRVHENAIMRLLRDFSLLDSLPDETLRELAQCVEYRTVAKGYAAHHQGETPNALIMCVSGRVSIKMRNDSNITTVVGEVGKGEWFGEAGLLMEGSRGNYYSRATISLYKDPDHDEAKEDLKTKRVAPLRETYFCEEACEFLLFLKDDFDKFLRGVCNELQKEKFRILKRSKVFKGWEVDAIIRLSRFARMKVLQRNEKVLEQNKKVDHVYFIHKGIAKVTKVPDRVAQLKRERTALTKALDFSRARYSYHRSLHTPAGRGSGRSATTGKSTLSMTNTTATKSEFSGTIAKASVKIDGKGVFMGEDHVTKGEMAQEEMEARILEIDRKIARFGREDREREDAGKARKEQEIDTLVAPAIFGVECILDPENRIAMGTVTTDTVVHALVLHNIMFQAFDITADFLENVKRRAVQYPDDVKLAAEIDSRMHWDKYKEKQMEVIKKGKWRVGAETGTFLKELPGGRSIVMEGMQKKGDLLRGVF